MNIKVIKKWNEKAWSLSSFSDVFSVPFHIILAEAVDVARFAQRNWEPGKSPAGLETRPGLGSAAGSGAFQAETVSELLELVDALQQAQTNYRLLVSGSRAAPMERATFVLTEIRSTLEWCFDDGQETDEDGQLENLAREHEGALSQDALAAALFDYAELGSRVEEKIAGLGGFDVALLDEARALASRLREQSAGPAAPHPRPAEREALELRNRLATLLQERVARVRAAARFVFRRHPELIKEVGSAYARRRRAANRKASAEGELEKSQREEVNAA
jgi:hypothetical protein